MLINIIESPDMLRHLYVKARNYFENRERQEKPKASGSTKKRRHVCKKLLAVPACQSLKKVDFSTFLKLKFRMALSKQVIKRLLV